MVNGTYLLSFEVGINKNGHYLLKNGHLNQTDRAIYCVFLQVSKFRVTASLYIHSHRPIGTMTAVREETSAHAVSW